MTLLMRLIRCESSPLVYAALLIFVVCSERGEMEAPELLPSYYVGSKMDDGCL